MPNGFSGVSVMAAHSNVIGDTELSARNVISGNTYYGIQIAAGSSGNAIRGNYVGPDIAGGRAMGNGRSGIRVESSANSFEAQNVISGNTLDGIVIAGAGASNNVVRGNLIGTTAAGNAAHVVHQHHAHNFAECDRYDGEIIAT